jgi:hypothetical protein
MTAWPIFDESKDGLIFYDRYRKENGYAEEVDSREQNRSKDNSFLFGFAGQMSVHAPILPLPIVQDDRS